MPVMAGSRIVEIHDDEDDIDSGAVLSAIRRNMEQFFVEGFKAVEIGELLGVVDFFVLDAVVEESNDVDTQGHDAVDDKVPKAKMYIEVNKQEADQSVKSRN